MPNKQQEFYSQLRQETETKVQTHNEFAAQIKTLETRTRDAITALKADQKFLAKQIKANNKMLASQDIEPVKFDG